MPAKVLHLPKSGRKNGPAKKMPVVSGKGEKIVHLTGMTKLKRLRERVNRLENAQARKMAIKLKKKEVGERAKLVEEKEGDLLAVSVEIAKLGKIRNSTRKKLAWAMERNHKWGMSYHRTRLRMIDGDIVFLRQNGKKARDDLNFWKKQFTGLEEEQRELARTARNNPERITKKDISRMHYGDYSRQKPALRMRRRLEIVKRELSKKKLLDKLRNSERKSVMKILNSNSKKIWGQGILELYKTGSVKSIPVFLQLLKHPEKEIRSMAIAKIRKLRLRDCKIDVSIVVNAILPRLKDKDFSVRRYAINYLPEICSRKHVVFFKRAMKMEQKRESKIKKEMELLRKNRALENEPTSFAYERQKLNEIRTNMRALEYAINAVNSKPN